MYYGWLDEDIHWIKITMNLSDSIRKLCIHVKHCVREYYSRVCDQNIFIQDLIKNDASRKDQILKWEKNTLLTKPS